MVIELDHVITHYGGRMVYWNETDGHQREMLAASFVRPSSQVAG